MNNSINTDLKNMFTCLYDVFCLLSLNKFNSIYIIFHYLISFCIFLPIFNFMPITHHNMMLCNLELHLLVHCQMVNLVNFLVLAKFISTC